MTALAANVVHFARVLRRAGLPVGPAETLAAAEALATIDLSKRTMVRAALAAVMVHRREHREVFDEAFRLFWRDPEAARAGLAIELFSRRPELRPHWPSAGALRVTEAVAARTAGPEEAKKRREVDAVATASERERLQKMDFEAMGTAEITAAKAEIRRLRLPLDLLPMRRFHPAQAGETIDLRATIRASLRYGGEMLEVACAARQRRPSPLVVLCDISGSMARYTRILLHFLHAVANDRDRVQVFLFGTRLTNVTRQLRHRDPEVAFHLVSHVVPDFSGGTRIGAALGQFNRFWVRRVLAQGAVVLLVSDGLDRDGARDLAANMDRLHRSCRRLIWLNPLLRWEGFLPRSQGIRAMLPHVDDFRTVHNLASLGELVDLLSRPPGPRRMSAAAWRMEG